MKLVTAEEMRGIEARFAEQGGSLADLMQQAGAAVADVVRDSGLMWEPVLVLVGPGNNGGDGLVAAQRLYEMGRVVQVYAWKHMVDDPVYQSAQEAGFPITRFEVDTEGAALAT